jgi:3-phenylpropionate/trans-cinnamate dioxygenase ferredoxin subunit
MAFIPYSSFQLNEKQLAVISIEGRSICITKYRNEWYAFLNSCPHASVPLDNGFVDALGFMVCPLHRYRFSVKNGRDSNHEGYRMKTFPVTEGTDGLELLIEHLI